MAKIVNSKDINAWKSIAQQTTNYILWRDKLSTIAMSLFHWKGFPERTDTQMGVNVRYLEKVLYSEGKIAVFNDPIMGIVCMRCSNAGANPAIDIYDEPTKVLVVANNGYHKWIDAKDCVVIYNDYNKLPSMPMIEFYAAKLAYIELISALNLNAQKNPFFLKGNEQQRKTLEALFEQVQWSPVIYGPKDKDGDSVLNDIEVVDMKVDLKIRDFQAAKKEVLVEFMTFCGVPSSREKAEVVLSDQINMDMGMSLSAKQSSLNARQEACIELKNKLGLDVECEFRAFDWDTIVDKENGLDDNKPENSEEEKEVEE